VAGDGLADLAGADVGVDDHHVVVLGSGPLPPRPAQQVDGAVERLVVAEVEHNVLFLQGAQHRAHQLSPARPVDLLPVCEDLAVQGGQEALVLQVRRALRTDLVNHFPEALRGDDLLVARHNDRAQPRQDVLKPHGVDGDDAVDGGMGVAPGVVVPGGHLCRGGEVRRPASVPGGVDRRLELQPPGRNDNPGGCLWGRRDG